MILRLYGTARAIHRNDPQWDALHGLFDPIPGARQVFELEVDLVQTSCGMAVPYYDYQEDRQLLRDWAEQKTDVSELGSSPAHATDTVGLFVDDCS